jgi:hypothetical protein
MHIQMKITTVYKLYGGSSPNLSLLQPFGADSECLRAGGVPLQLAF